MSSDAAPAAAQGRACDGCLARAWLLSRLGSHLDRVRSRLEPVLALTDEQLIAAVGGRGREAVLAEHAKFDADLARRRAAESGLELLCRCQRDYPARLLELESAPAVLHVAGGLTRFLRLVDEEAVAIVGARRASQYGLEVARALGRGLGGSGLTVISGMALGVDGAAHAGALAADGLTVAVLPGGADRAYPASNRGLHRRIIDAGTAVSELPPGSSVHRWAFPARNRIIAALAAMTVVVEAGPYSGSLVTARIAERLGRPVGAVPGRVAVKQAEGSNALLAAGAHFVRDAQDVLDHLFGAGVRTVAAEPRPEVDSGHRRLLAAIAEGHDTVAAIARAGIPAEEGLAALAFLELNGHIRRGPGGRFAVIP